MKQLFFYIVLIMLVCSNKLFAQEVVYYDDEAHKHTCTLVPKAFISGKLTRSCSRGVASITNKSGDIKLEPKNCLQVALDNGIIATAVFDARYGGVHDPISLWVQNTSGAGLLKEPAITKMDPGNDINDIDHNAISSMILKANNDFIVLDNENHTTWASNTLSIPKQQNQAKLYLLIVSDADGYQLSVRIDYPSLDGRILTKELISQKYRTQ